MTLCLIVVIESYAVFGIGDMHGQLRRNMYHGGDHIKSVEISRPWL